MRQSSIIFKIALVVRGSEGVIVLSSNKAHVSANGVVPSDCGYYVWGIAYAVAVAVCAVVVSPVVAYRAVVPEIVPELAFGIQHVALNVKVAVANTAVSWKGVSVKSVVYRLG